MSGCNASLTVLLEGDDCESMVLKTLTCNVLGQHDVAAMPHQVDTVTWTDDAPGATPHQDPTLTYEAVQVVDDWVVDAVTATDRYAVCEYGGGVHPDPQGAAEAEARRLRCLPHDGDESLHGAWVCDGCGVEVERDPSIVSTAELERDEARERVAVLETALRECEVDHLTSERADELLAERLRYRKALERIEFLGNHPTMRDTLPASYEIARRVLDGGDA